MMNKNERMAKLNNAGINTGKYFSIDLPEGIKPGATISLVINEDGLPVVVNKGKTVQKIFKTFRYFANRLKLDFLVK